VLACLSAARAIEALGVDGVRIKWPDDVHVDGRKIAGLKVINQLGPGRIDSAIVTFRVNANVDATQLPDDLEGRATSISMETGAQVDQDVALKAFLKTFDETYDLEPARLLDGYRQRCETLGRSVRASLLPRGEVVGVASDVDASGTLLIDAGARTIGVNVDSLKKLEYLLASDA
jgi:BirA family biotin operon repressor/biotin-[acetyl-CoA-carboxylase] ligase